MLMQMCREDDFGQVPYDDFVELLQKLRVDSLHNALVETDVQQLRTHLILLCRRFGMSQEPIMSIWELRSVLLSADQLCLSRMQIHLILSILCPDGSGDVDVEYFLRVCCTVIPNMFDTVAFEKKAAMIAKEKADALAKQELEELQGLTSNMAKRRVDDEDQEEDKANAPDRDSVEKALIHIGNQADEKHRSNQVLDVKKFVEAMRSEAVQQCQLSDAELRGFIAEAEIDERGEVAYAEHIKTWVPIVFELRKSRIYDGVLSRDWGLNADHLVDLSPYEHSFPIMEFGQRYDEEDFEEGRNRRPGSASRNRPGSASRNRPGSARNRPQSGRRSLSKSGAEQRPGSARKNSRMQSTRTASKRRVEAGAAGWDRQRSGDSDGSAASGR